MPGTTPVYGFPYPEPTDLVADYPALGQQLAEDIETVLPTVSGMSRVTSQSFTTASSVSVNNCFTSTYRNYRILINITAASATDTRLLRLRAAGSDNTSANYYWGGVQQAGVNDATIYNIRSAGLATSHRLAYSASNCLIALDVFSPQESVVTSFSSQGVGATGDVWTEWVGGRSSVTTSYDGFTLFPNSGTITGTLSVYGLRNS